LTLTDPDGNSLVLRSFYLEQLLPGNIRENLVMIKALTRGTVKLFHFVETGRVEGPHSKMSGDCSRLIGDCSALSGNCSRLSGDCTGLYGNCSKMSGNCSGLTGNCSGLNGNCSGLRGDCSGLYGNCTGLRGDLDKCLLQDEDRAQRVDISELIKD